MTLASNIYKKLGVKPDVFLEHDSNSIQTKLASTLRHHAIKHLRQSNGVVARSFRGEYMKSGLGYPHDFLDAQAKNRAWGTYLEAAALGEQLGCNVVVTPVKEGINQDSICLYRAEDKNAKTIHLYNSNNTHWYVDNKTKGDGNCLYNACAQALQTHVKHEFPKPKSPTQSQAGWFKTKLNATKANIADTVEQQHKIFEAIQKQPTPKELEAVFNHEQERISKLSSEEQQQIQDDHKLSLTLAYGNMGYTHVNPIYIKAALEEEMTLRSSPPLFGQ
jgi:hypothetical protein